MLQYLKGGYKEDRGPIFTWKIGGMMSKVTPGDILLEHKWKYFTVKTVK